MTRQIEKKSKEKNREETDRHTVIYTQEVSAGKFDYMLVLLTTIDKRAILAICANDARS